MGGMRPLLLLLLAAPALAGRAECEDARRQVRENRGIDARMMARLKSHAEEACKPPKPFEGRVLAPQESLEAAVARQAQERAELDSRLEQEGVRRLAELKPGESKPAVERELEAARRRQLRGLDAYHKKQLDAIRARDANQRPKAT